MCSIFQEEPLQNESQTAIGNHEEANCKVNGKKSLLERIKIKKPKKEKKTEAVAHYTLLDVLKNAKLRMYALIMCLLW